MTQREPILDQGRRRAHPGADIKPPPASEPTPSPPRGSLTARGGATVQLNVHLRAELGERLERGIRHISAQRNTTITKRQAAEEAIAAWLDAHGQ